MSLTKRNAVRARDGASGIGSKQNPPDNSFRAERQVRRQHQAAHIHAAGPRPVLEALLAVAAGQSLDDVLADFARIPVSTYHALGADELPIHLRRLN
jgi:hypothetical protein